MKRTRARSWALPFALLAAVLIATAWLSREIAPALDTGEDVERSVSEVAATMEGSRATVARGRDRLAPISGVDKALSEKEAHGTARVLDHEDVSLPPVGTVRFCGVVVDDDGAPIKSEGAVVRVYEGPTNDEGPTLLGSAPVSLSGHFQLDITQFAARSRFNDSEVWIYGQLVAPGYHTVEDGGSLDEFRNGVLRVRMETSSGGPLVWGRVVDLEGQPVRAARIRYLEWGRLAQTLQDGECESDSDGLFGFQLDEGGWVDAVAVHPSHGMAKAGGRLEPPTQQLDLGTLVLEPRGIISGVVMGYGGRAIPFHSIDIEAASEDEDAVMYGVRTDARGAFRYANLDRVPYRLYADYYAGEPEEQPVYTPDTQGVVLRIPHPTATVSVLGPDGKELIANGFACRAIDAEGRAITGSTGGRWINENTQGDGTYELLFGSPGRYSVGAHIWVDDVRWSASQAFTLGKEHRDIELQLEQDDGGPVEFRVLNAAGDPVPAWRVSVTERMTGLKVVSATNRRSQTRIEPGTYDARVVPFKPSFALPFVAEFEVGESGSDGPAVVELLAGPSGGRLVISVQASDGHKIQVFAHVKDKSTRKSIGRTTACRVDGTAKDFPELLPPGSYDLTVSRGATVGIPKAKRTHSFEIEAGEVTRVVLAFPGKG